MSIKITTLSSDESFRRGLDAGDMMFDVRHAGRVYHGHTYTIRGKTIVHAVEIFGDDDFVIAADWAAEIENSEAALRAHIQSALTASDAAKNASAASYDFD